MKNITTRLISGALAASMMLSVCPVSAFATYRQTEAEKAVAAYAAAQNLDEENTTSGKAISADSTITPDSVTQGYTQITAGGTYTVAGGDYTGYDTGDYGASYHERFETIVINTTENVTLNIQGDIKLKESQRTFIRVENVGTLTISGNGHKLTTCVETTDTYSYLIGVDSSAANSNIVVDNCTLETKYGTVIDAETGTVILKNTTLSGNGSSWGYASVASGSKLVVESGSKIEVEGEWVQNRGTVEMQNGVTFGEKANRIRLYEDATIAFASGANYSSAPINVYAVRLTQVDKRKLADGDHASSIKLVDNYGDALSGYEVKYESGATYAVKVVPGSSESNPIVISPDDAEATTISSAGTWTVKGGEYTKQNPIVIENTSADDKVVLNIEDDVELNYTASGWFGNPDSSFVKIESPCTLVVNGKRHTIKTTGGSSNCGSVIQTGYGVTENATITLNDCTVEHSVSSVSNVSPIEVYGTKLMLNNTTVTSVNDSSSAVLLANGSIQIGDNVKLGNNGYIKLNGKAATIEFVGQNTSAYQDSKLNVYFAGYDGNTDAQLTPKNSADVSNLLQLVDGDGNALEGCTIKYNSEEKYNYVAKSSQTSAELELDENGYPTESKGGTLDVTHSNWKYSAVDKKLTLLEGTFDLGTTEIGYAVTVGDGTSADAKVTLENANISGKLIINTNGVVNGGTFTGTREEVENYGVIKAGTFVAREITNYPGSCINGGSFMEEYSTIYNYGTITDGVFWGAVVNGYANSGHDELKGTINGGIFPGAVSGGKTTNIINGGVFSGKYYNDNPQENLCKIRWTSYDYTVNGMSVDGYGPAKNYIRVIATDNHPQTFTINSPEANTSWSFSNGTDTLTVKAGQSNVSGFGGKVVASASADGKNLTLTVTDTASLGNLTMETLTLPAAKAEDYTIEMDGSKLTADGSSLAYDKDAARKITVTRKATGDAAAAELTADQFTTTITRDGEPVESIGLPGEYNVTVSIHDGVASGDLAGYTFTIEKAEVDEAAMQVLLENFSFNIGAEYSYPNWTSPSSNTNQTELKEAGFGTDISLTGYQKQQANGTWGDIIKDDPVNDPGTYAPVYTVSEGSVYPSVTLTYKDYCNSEKIKNKTFTVVAGHVDEDDFTPGETFDKTNPETNPSKDETKLGKLHIVYYDQNGEKVSEDTAPTEPGTYKVGFRYDASEYYQAFDYGPVAGWTYEVKETPAAELFQFEVAADTTYTGAPIGAKVTINSSTKGITVKYKDEHGNVTAAQPTDAGTYTVLIDYAGSDKYAAVSDLEVGEFTINRADLTADDFTYDENTHRVHSEKVEDEFIHVIYRRTDAEGPARVFTDELPTIAGTYEITYTVDRTPNYNSMAETAVAETYTVDKLTADDISASDLLISIPFLPSYSGKAKEVTADVLDPNKLPGTITVNYYTDAACKDESKLPEGELPTNAGTYYFTITVGESYNNEEVTLTPSDNSFTIKPASEVVEGEVAVKVPENLYEDEDEKGITLDFGSTGLTEEDVTITYTNTDSSEDLPEGTLPKERGTYSYTVTVKNAKGNYAAGTVLAEGEYIIKAEKADDNLEVSYGDVSWDDKQNGEPLTVGAKVTITAPEDSDVSVFHSWIITVDGQELTTAEELKALGIEWDETDPDADPRVQRELTFTMPKGKVNIAAYTSRTGQIRTFFLR